MNSKQLKAKLSKAGFRPEHVLEVNRDEITVGVESDVPGVMEYEASEALVEEIRRIFGAVHAFRTGYNGWVVSINEAARAACQACRSNEIDQFGVAQ